MSSFQTEMVQGSLGDTWHRRCSDPESRTGMAREVFVGGGNRINKVLMAWKIWSMYREK